ncbi:8535_t:CDS:2 [Cetraspora pellucida]|uniref:8535_t:CDS:1 n=1 Tax=Cetraspora pellucida TaxID=1433469 RepID=A0ACA9LN99_9GLOM|nr:8535_t:CDS:2 [Cetraspora pellucida]
MALLWSLSKKTIKIDQKLQNCKKMATGSRIAMGLEGTLTKLSFTLKISVTTLDQSPYTQEKKKKKTSVLDAEVESEFYFLKDKPNKNNNKNVKSWASNIEQEGKPVGKCKQKAIPSTSEDNKAKDPLLMEINHKDTDDKIDATNLDQDETIKPLNSNKKNKAEEKEFTLITSKKNN